NRKSQQQIGVWSHGRQRQYLTSKAEAAGITVVLVDEAYTSQTCPGTLPDARPVCTAPNPRGASIAARRAVLGPIVTASGPPTCSRGTPPGSPDMCGQGAKRIVTPSGHPDGASVARWTRGNWLGFRPSAREDAPGKPRPVMGRGVSRAIIRRGRP